MRLTEEQIAAIRDGTEGVTPGPWASSDWSEDDGPNAFTIGAASNRYRVAETHEGDNPLKDAAHIARCDPDTIRTLATEVLESRATIETLTKKRDEARAEIADSKLENGYVLGWNSGWDEAFQRLKFPTMLHKIWSGGEVQRWLDERRAEQKGPVPGSLSERMFAAEAQRDAANAAAEAHEAKWKSICKAERSDTGSCACSYDQPGDVCLWHSLKLVEAEARVAELEGALASLIVAVSNDIAEAKKRLDADTPKDAPAHSVSAFLTGTMIAVGRARAALGRDAT